MSDELNSRGQSAAVRAAVETLRERDAETADQRALPLPGLLPDAGPIEAEGDGERRGPGRPAGSRNRRNQEWADWLLSRYRSPLQALAEVYNRPLEDLVGEVMRISIMQGLKVSDGLVLEILKVQLRAAVELAPYIHQKQPQAVELGDGQGLVHLSFNLGGEAANVARQAGVPVDGEPGRMTLELQPLDPQHQRNQALSDAAQAVRDAEISDNAPKMAENSEE